jgi:hypothetical protein
MLHLAPRDLPALHDLYDALGRPTAQRLAALLQITPATVRRWLRSGRCPRSAQLALYWLTPWGQSAVDAELVNRSTLSAQVVTALERELADARRELARVAALACYGSANAPSMRADLLVWRVK